MNVYTVIILVALLAEYVLNTAAALLNLKALQTTLPDEFSEVFDTEKYHRSQEYTRVRTRFGLLSATFDLVLLLAFWFSGGFNWLDGIVRSWELGPIWTGLAFVGVLVGAGTIISLPFKIYSTFVIEEQFGFNKTTPGTFVTDTLKELALTVILGGALLAGLLAFFEYAGDFAWLYCWGMIIAVMFLVQWIAPTWLLPLFNKFTPLEEGELREKILAYANSVNFPLVNVFVVDGSRRSGKANAFFTGFGKNKRVALFDTLIEQQTVPELVAVVAHEIGHYKRKHIIQRTLISVLHTGVLLFLLSIFLSRPGLFEAFYMDTMSIYAGLFFFMLLFSPINAFLSILMGMLSRKNEFEADAYARETTGTPEAMISALKKLSAENLSNLTPHPFYVVLNYSHPPMLERIAALRQ